MSIGVEAILLLHLSYGLFGLLVGQVDLIDQVLCSRDGRVVDRNEHTRVVAVVGEEGSHPNS